MLQQTLGNNDGRLVNRIASAGAAPWVPITATPPRAARVIDAIQQRLTVVLRVAEDLAENYPKWTSRSSGAVRQFP
jgi:hypothetical protein